jgi:hypothetical protein
VTSRRDGTISNESRIRENRHYAPPVRRNTQKDRSECRNEPMRAL